MLDDSLDVVGVGHDVNLPHRIIVVLHNALRVAVVGPGEFIVAFVMRRVLVYHGLIIGFFDIVIRVKGLNVARIGLSLYFEEQVGAFSLEEGVAELDFICRPLALMEVIHVKLTNERVKIVMLEIRGKRVPSKALFVRHFET